MRAENISEEQIFKKIFVRKPYYALKNLKVVGDELRAIIPVEQPLGMEAGPITVAEASRHLAILGSCAIAFFENKSEDGFVYIALGGIQNNFLQEIGKSYKTLHGFAKGEFIDKRKARAKTRLIADTGELIYKIDIDFYIISGKIFKRKYEAFKQDIKGIDVSNYNPYKEVFPLYDLCVDGNTLNVSLGMIKPEYCMGHFPSYPILPVAILSYYQVKAISLLLDGILGITGAKYKINHGTLKAYNFAFAGDKLNFAVKLAHVLGREYTFECIATSGSGTKIAVATATLTYL